MLDRALDWREITPSRRDSLEGLRNVIADVDDTSRTALLPPVLEMARGDHDGGPADRILSRVMRAAPATLADLALQCAAGLAINETHHVQIAQIGIAVMNTMDEAGQWRVGSTLARLPRIESMLDPGQWAADPMSAKRALAADIWARNPTVLTPEAAVRLARDDDHRVRQVLALALNRNRTDLGNDEIVQQVVNMLASDPRRSVRGPVSSL